MKISRSARRIAGWSFGILVVALAALVANAQWVLRRDYGGVAQPSIAADHTRAAVARGEMLFQALCMECHGGADGRASGKHLAEVPAFLGTMYSANLAHPITGVHKRTDGEIARVLRYGVLPNGKLSPAMNGFDALGDADIAAILGYMRSGAAPFAPGGEAQPATRVSLVGSLILAYVAKIYTRNITFDEATGIGRWSVDEFERAVTRGVRPDGVMVRKPMPLFARLDRTDVEAIYGFLRTMPRVRRDNKAGGHPVERARANASPAELFVSIGCASCHGDSAPHRDKIAGAASKSDAELAAWILDPQATRPGSIMPSFRGALAPEQAERLGRYVRELAGQRSGS